jgi:hypothetical protein
MMSEERTWKRIRERLELKLPVRVSIRETPDFEWMEVTRLIDVTPYGAGFTLKRPTEKGRLLHLTIPMPRQLRTYDHVEDQYRVWAIVRHVQVKVQPDNKPTIFDVGVAFIGKRPPASYEAEPSKRYEISTSAVESIAAAEESIKPLTTSDQRIHTRHNIAIDVVLEVIDEKGLIAQREQTVTENISRKGATMFTTLEVPAGRFVRLTSKQYKTTHAAVRARSTGADGIPRIHVEFVDQEWA